MDVTDIEMRKVVDAWLLKAAAEKSSAEYKANEWATALVCDWTYDEGGDEKLWLFILEAYMREMSELSFAVLAAGALEDLLADHGAKYIDRVEELARKDPQFNRLLGGVWKNSMTDDIWDRVQKARNQTW